MAAKVSVKSYALVWIALMALLAATWGFSNLDLKAFNIVVALSIALAKLFLILLFFMHLKYSTTLVWVFAGAGFLSLFIMFDLVMTDYLTRGFSWSQ